jgi:hypothetical protein
LNIEIIPAYVLGIELDDSSSSDEKMEECMGAFSDDEWEEEKEQEEASVSAEKDNAAYDSTSKTGVAVMSNVIPLNNALGALMGTYASDDSDEGMCIYRHHQPFNPKIG